MRAEGGVNLDGGIAQAYARAMPRAAPAGKAFKAHPCARCTKANSVCAIYPHEAPRGAADGCRSL